MKKRIISLLLAIVLAVSCLPVNAMAAVDTSLFVEPTIVVDSKVAAAGAIVNVDLLVVNNPGIAGAKITISYDENLKLIDAISGETFAALDYTRPGIYTSPCNFNWDSENAEVNKNGVLLTLVFQVSEDAAPNEILDINLSYRYGHIYNADLDSVAFDMVSGHVNVIDYIPGDVNSDGEVSGKDVTLIRRHNAGGYDQTINEAAADVNDDGDISGKDVTLVRRYNAGGYDVELRPSTPKCRHDMQATAAKPANCTEDGNCAYWYCLVCEKYFADEIGSTEISLSDAVIPAAHAMNYVEAKAATTEKEGYIEHWKCSMCGKYFADSNGAKELDEAAIIIKPLAPSESNIQYRHYVRRKNADGSVEIVNDEYLSSHGIVNPNPTTYVEGKGIHELVEGVEIDGKKMFANGYSFLGWYEKPEVTAKRVYDISASATGDKVLYGIWSIDEYTVTFDSPDVPVKSVKYTVDKGVTLENPKCFGYTFVGWSNDEGFIVNRIKPGSTGHMTLHANWTSDRNKATSYQSYDEPIIIEDDANGQILFVYNIGKIDNVPLNEVEFIGKTETLNYKKEVDVVDKVEETFVDNINKMISEATTKSSGWTLSKEWNDIYSTQEEVGNLTEKSDERTTSEGKTVGGKYFVSNSQGGSTHVSTESGGSSANSSKVTTENSVGINASYDHTTEKYCDAKLGASNTTEVSAGVEVPVKVAKVSAGVKNTTTVEAEVKNGRKDTDSFHIDGSISNYVGTVNTSDSSAYFNSSVSNSSNWNSTTGYEQSMETSRNDSVTNAIKEQISKTTTHNLSKALGEVNSETAEKQEQQMSSEEYSTSFTYNKGTQTSVKKTFEFNSSEPGYYRIITAGTVHVYGVVGYDVATASYYTYCYNVLDDTTREIMDYSKDNGLFNDCENGVVTFEVPYEVNEYVAGFMGKTTGLEISYEGVVTGFTAADDFDGTVVIPQYEAKNNKDGSFSAVKVTSFAASAFAGKENIKTIVLPVYITEIPDGAFAGCTNLERVIAFGVTKIGANAFKDCVSLNKFSMDNAITSLGTDAFKNVPEIEITAYDSKVADAAIACGAKKISVNVAYIKDTYANKVVKVGSDVEAFAFIGNGGEYKNIRIESNAAETMISNMIFVNNADNPIKLGSAKVTLARVTVEKSPAIALILTADNVNLELLGKISLNSAVENTVLSKNVTLNMADLSTTSSLIINGKYLVCGEVTNRNYLNVVPTQITKEQFESYLVSSVVTFNANGGSVDQTSKIVYMNQPYGALPTPQKQYFAFKGWYTSAEGGTQITANTMVSATVNQTLYAHWEAITATLKFNANGGNVATSSKVVYTGEKVGALPTPTRDFYTFDGWYTAATGGDRITENSVLTAAETKTLYARWIHHTVSGWVRASEVPSGAEIVNRKWSYTLTTTTESRETSLAGYTQTGSYWVESGRGSVNYATFPTGFNTSHHIYTSFAKSALSGYENATSKRVVSDSWGGYVYWHWMYDVGYANTTTRTISHRQGSWNANGGSGGNNYKYFYALTSTVDCKYLDTYYCCSQGLPSYNCHNILPSDKTHIGTPRFFRFNYRVSSYVDYYKMFQYKKVENKESTTQVTASNSITNVQEWVQYRAK